MGRCNIRIINEVNGTEEQKLIFKFGDERPVNGHQL